MPPLAHDHPDLGQSVEILSGLTGGDRLIVNPPDRLKAGSRVAGQEAGRAPTR